MRISRGIIKQLLFALFLVELTIGNIFPQYQETPVLHTNEYGASFTVAMSGFGIGGFYRIALPKFIHVGGNVDFFIMKGDRELTLYTYYGYIDLNKFNRLFLIPAHIELKERIFPNSIEYNFRPFFVQGFGFTFGMNFPTKEAKAIANIPHENEYRFTLGATIGFGVDITTNENYFVSIRPQYRFVYFPEKIAGKKNHSNFEIRIDLGKRQY